MSRRLAAFLPSLLFGLAGGVWVALDPPRLGPALPWPWLLLAGAGLAAGLLLAAWLLESLLPSFRYASRLLERALAPLRLSVPAAALLALLTAAGEELFFRGGLMQLLGVWGQAVAFGLLHPATRRGWAYSAYAVLAGAAFGYAAELSGSLLTPLLAHGLINLQGLLSLSRTARRSS